MCTVNDRLSGNIQKPPDTCRKPPRLVYVTKNLPESYWKPARNLRGGFLRFLDNPSLTDHTVVSKYGNDSA